MDDKKPEHQPPNKASGGSVFDAFKINQVSLRGFISRFTVSSHDIEDVCQEAFLRAYRAEQKGTIEQPKAYLFRVAKNILINGLRSKTNSVTDYVGDMELLDILPEGDTLEANIAAQQRVGIYCEAIAALPAQCRRVMLMKKIHGLPTKEVAARLSITTSTVEKHMTKGLKHCNAVLAERYDSEDSAVSTVGSSHQSKTNRERTTSRERTE